MKWMACTVVLWACLLVDSGAEQPFEFGSRPPNHIYAGTGDLNAEMVLELAKSLEEIKKVDDVDVIAVVLEDLEGAPPLHVASRLADEWAESAIHAVVLHVPGLEDSPWIHPGGRLTNYLQPEQMRRRLGEARRRASMEPTDSDIVKAAAIEVSDVLRFWRGTAINRSESLETARTRMKLELESKARQRRIIILASLAAVVPLAVGLSMLVSVLKRQGPRYFPEPMLPQRLGAPHAGGNHAQVSFGYALKKKGP